jgi:hypothetical protein
MTISEEEEEEVVGSSSGEEDFDDFGKLIRTSYLSSRRLR